MSFVYFFLNLLSFAEQSLTHLWNSSMLGTTKVCLFSLLSDCVNKPQLFTADENFKLDFQFGEHTLHDFQYIYV